MADEKIKAALVQSIAPQQTKVVTAPDTTAAPQQVNRTTAIPILDRTVGGGLPSGSVVYIFADAKSMAEVFLYQFTQARKTYYFTAERHPKYVMNDIKNYGFKPENITFVDIYSAYYITAQGEMVDNIGNEFVEALYHFPVIFKIRLTPIDANLRQQMRKSVKSASKIITGITGFWNSAVRGCQDR